MLQKNASIIEYENQDIGGVEMNKGEKEKCQETKEEFYNIMTEMVPDERQKLIREYLNSHKVSNRIEKFLKSLIV